MSEKADKVEYRGRRKIYTDVDRIDESNVIDVLSKAMIVHEQNRQQIQYLINFDKGHQPLMREKIVRKEIDVKNISNLAHQIVEFWLGYFWGNHMAFVQRSEKHPKDVDSGVSDSAMTLLNEMYEAEDMESKDQLLAYYLEVCGICPQLIDYKRNIVDEEDAPFDLVTLNPLFAFVVYSSDAYERKMMGVSYVEKEDGSKLYTCITDDRVFIIKDMLVIVNGISSKRQMTFTDKSGEANPFGQVNIVEFERSNDRTGVFERQIDELNALNILESDLVNDVAQTTQANWWANDVDFEEDENGNLKQPEGGQWIVTGSTQSGGKPDIKPLVLNYDYVGIIQNIQNKHDGILERTFTPLQKEQSGGSTTGATSLSSGWTATEAVACKKAAIIKRGYRERNRLVLKAIKLCPDYRVDSPIKTLRNSDIEIRPIRQKTFDMATKINSLATMIKNMVHPRVAMESIDFFPNLAEAIESSIPKMLEYQDSLISKSATTPNEDIEENQADPDKVMPDSSDQTENSPLKDL